MSSWRIHDRYASDPGMRIECLQPVFRTGGRARDRLERFLPDRWSLLPQQADYFTTPASKNYGLPDLDARGWEEFVWQDRPFGFHVRSQPKLKGQESLADHLAEVQEVLRELTGPTAATVSHRLAEYHGRRPRGRFNGLSTRNTAPSSASTPLLSIMLA